MSNEIYNILNNACTELQKISKGQNLSIITKKIYMIMICRKIKYGIIMARSSDERIIERFSRLGRT